MGNSFLASDPTQFIREVFRSRDRTINVDIYKLPEVSQPAVILLHGADGLSLRYDAYAHFAGFLARRGFGVFLVHYFDGTGVEIADRAIMREKFPGWVKTISDAIQYAGSRQGSMPDRTGILGFSLGASLALSVAATQRDVSAVVEYSGGMPRVTEAILEAMPPTLIIHGAEDRIVPVEEAYRLEKLLKERDCVYEMRIFPKDGHALGEEAAAEAAFATAAFFDKYLRPGVTETGELREDTNAHPDEAN